MKKVIFTILKILGALLLVLVLALAFLYFKGTSYQMYALSADQLEIKESFTSEEYQALAEQLVAEMSLEEKIDQMYGEKYFGGMTKLAVNALFKSRFAHIYVGRNERLGIPPWVLSDGPRGARVMDKSVEAVTTFPVSMSRGASWNTDLEYRINQVIAKEMRANKTNYAATPCINLLRHPGWGRAQETYGEDPWHLGEFGVAAVKAIEEQNVM
ncbi:MAG: glycoside hydrolase family 3 N-terminal domain-containing protein, partial [Bacteroidota bacterium]